MDENVLLKLVRPHALGPQHAECSSQLEIRYRTAKTREDLAGAFRLLQQRYQAAGLAKEVKTGMRVMPYQLSPTAQIFVADLAGQMIGTVTLVVDEPQKLPLASSYPCAMADLQTRSAALGEITSLAIDSTKARRSEVFKQLSRLLTFFARARGLENLVAVVHPRHSRFYQHAMGFEIIGEEVPCDLVGGRPGVAVLGHVSDASRFATAWRRHYFDGGYDAETLVPHSISLRDQIHFAQFVQLPAPLRRGA